MSNDREIIRSYTTSDICSMYGLSVSGLRYFEEKGLIHPQREQGNRYRVFSLTDCSRLFFCRMLRQYGFSMDQSVQLVLSATPEEYQDKLTRQERLIEAEIARKQLLLGALRRTRDLIHQSAHALPVELTFSPSFLRLRLRSSGRHGGACENTEDFQKWYAALPFTAASLRFDRSAMNEPGGEYTYDMGFIITVQEAAGHGIVPNENTSLLPSRPCLYTILHGRDDLNNIHTNIPAILREISDRQLALCGDPVTRMICSLDTGKGMERFDEAWFPIEPAQR